MKTLIAFLVLAAAAGAADQRPARSYGYRDDVQPILEKSCVICHACYDAPCQLKMETPDGLERGATKAPVYKAGVAQRETTRLFVDAASTGEWRGKGFHSVVEGGAASLMARMLELGRKNAKAGERVPDSVPMGILRENVCADGKDFDAYAHRRMHEGMPFGMAPLAVEDYRALQGWLAQGAPFDGAAEPDRGPARGMIARWEEFLNRPAKRDRLLARYLYEHLFVAHLYFDRGASSGFFELVRSSTRGGDIHPIATRRPTDDPGDEVWYRIRPVRGSIVEKTHITYYAGQEKLDRIARLFGEEAWKVAELPPYQRNGCSNPFKAFAQIPARARYQFMLDDAFYFVQCFIRGPVCLGQIATDVIEDHFFVMFQRPTSDRFLSDAAYAAEQLQDVSLDGREGWSINVMPKWMAAQVKYARRRARKYAGTGPSFEDVWDGDGANPDAALTVLRNFDSATVIRGLRGRTPKTVWVMDYPIFERIYYLLVANFDVFGSASHQIGTRLYFDLLRAESEVNFLNFLPREARKATWQSWYRGTSTSLKVRAIYPTPDEDSGTQVRLGGGDPKSAFVDLVRQRMPSIAGAAGDLAGAIPPDADARFASSASRAAEAALAPLAEGTGATRPFLKNLPETTFIRVVVDGGEADLAFTLSRVKAHTSVAFMFREQARLEPDNDYLALFRGPVGCYPNFVFRVKAADVPEFVAKLSAADGEAEFKTVVGAYGVRRTHPSFWDDFAFFRQFHARRDPVEAGIHDANRYANY